MSGLKLFKMLSSPTPFLGAMHGFALLFLWVVAMTGALPAAAQLVVQDGFETRTFDAAWGITTGVAIPTTGGALGSSNYAALAGTSSTTGRELGARFDTAVAAGGAQEFQIDFFFRTKGITREFDLQVTSSTGAFNSNSGAPRINLCYETNAWRCYSGGWHSVAGLGSVTAGAWYRMKVSGWDWGKPGAHYGLQLSNAGGSTFTSASSTNLTWYQDGSPTNSGARYFLFSSVYGPDPGFDVDEVTATVTPPRITGHAIATNGNIQLNFTGSAGQHYSVRSNAELTTPLANWPIETNGTLIAGVGTFSAAAATNTSARFFAVAGGRHHYRIMPVGDSITEGGSTFSVYRYPLYQKLTNAQYSFEYVGSKSTTTNGIVLYHEGYSGQNAEYICGVLSNTFPAHPADIVLIHAGHNHFYDEVPPPVPGIISATESMIATCRGVNPHVIILLAQVITSSKLPKYSYIPELNTNLYNLAASLNTPDQPVIIVNQADGWDPVNDTISDGVHPNEGGAEKMGQHWYDALITILQ